MIIMKIIGIVLAVIAVLALLLYLVRVKLVIAYTAEGKMQFRVKVLCFTFGGKKKKPKKVKKPNRFAERIKKKLGLDVFDSAELKADIEKGALTEKVNQIVALVLMFAGQIKWLFSKLRIDRLYALIVCGGDAAEAAIDYGIVCAAVYPMAGYLAANMNMKKDAEDVRVCCDFEGEARIEFELIISIRILHLLTALINALGDMAVIAEHAEVIGDER